MRTEDSGSLAGPLARVIVCQSSWPHLLLSPNYPVAPVVFSAHAEHLHSSFAFPCESCPVASAGAFGNALVSIFFWSILSNTPVMYHAKMQTHTKTRTDKYSVSHHAAATHTLM